MEFCQDARSRPAVCKQPASARFGTTQTDSGGVLTAPEHELWSTVVASHLVGFVLLPWLKSKRALRNPIMSVHVCCTLIVLAAHLEYYGTAEVAQL